MTQPEKKYYFLDSFARYSSNLNCYCKEKEENIEQSCLGLFSFDHVDQEDSIEDVDGDHQEDGQSNNEDLKDGLHASSCVSQLTEKRMNMEMLLKGMPSILCSYLQTIRQ